MYKNIGVKIQILAIVIALLESMGSVVSGIVLLLFNEAEPSKLTGILLIVLGPLFAWIGSFILYGFGQLIESSVKTEMDVAEIKRFLTYHQGADSNVAQPYHPNPQKPSAKPFRKSEPVPPTQDKTLSLYQDLLSKGLISPEAFEEVKRQILGYQ